MQQTELIGLTKVELEGLFIKIGEKPFRAKQVWQWIYFHGVTDFNEMNNLSKDLREKLAANFSISRPKVITEQIAEDKTHKWLLEFADGSRIETVYIPESDRGAVCVSSQVGCAVGCKFCNTGTQKVARNLTAGEIVSQFLVVKDVYKEWKTTDNRLVSNIVVMGMGEPLHNLENTVKALNIFTDPDGLAVSRRKITLSTAGIVPGIVKVIKETGVKLAISLHAPNNQKRSQIMPINRQYPLEKVLEACQEYQKLDGSRYVTFEYLMLKDFNDSLEDARELVALMKKYKLGAKFNLINFNPWPGCDFQPSSMTKVRAFAAEIEKGGFEAPLRKPRGQDILAACGQLKSKKE